jgi:hypothetical protein
MCEREDGMGLVFEQVSRQRVTQANQPGGVPCAVEWQDEILSMHEEDVDCIRQIKTTGKRDEQRKMEKVEIGSEPGSHPLALGSYETANVTQARAPGVAAPLACVSGLRQSRTMRLAKRRLIG